MICISSFEPFRSIPTLCKRTTLEGTEDSEEEEEEEQQAEEPSESHEEVDESHKGEGKRPHAFVAVAEPVCDQGHDREGENKEERFRLDS